MAATLHYRYFCYGVGLASISWAIIIVLYFQAQEPLRDNIPNMGYSKHRPVRLKPRTFHRVTMDSLQKVGGVKNIDRMANQFLLEGSSKKEKKKEEGKESNLEELGIIRTAEDQKLRDEGFRSHAFNLLISDRIGNIRPIPDTRHKLCKSKSYPSYLPKASVIICFYNEAWSSLIRTVHTVLERTSKQLLQEIILVDDKSDLPFLQDKLENYIKMHLPSVKVVRTGQREGLIRARIKGAEVATGEVLVFLDSHCEVNAQWLEPLLARIQESDRNVAVPIIDIVNADTFEYQASPLVRGGFNWGMHFRWDNIPPNLLKTEVAQANPIVSPTMAGGLFAMDRKYFYHLGKYDPGMDIWGGENLEISFRIWQCGGRLEIIPCSRVGHIFRKRRPYGSPQGKDTMTWNSLRVVHVWLDEYKKHYFKIRPEAESMQYGDVSDRVNLRKGLKCKSFKWYLENIYPEQQLPNTKGNVNFQGGMKSFKRHLPKPVMTGHLRHVASGLCVIAEQGIFSKRSMLVLKTCQESYAKQSWMLTEDRELILAELLCMDVENVKSSRSFPRIMKCHGSHGSQEWRLTGKGKNHVYNPSSGKCLAAEERQSGKYISMELCEEAESLKFEIVKL